MHGWTPESGLGRADMRVWLPSGILILWGLIALSSPWLPLKPNAIELPLILDSPSTYSLLGNDDLGRSVADRLIAGARTSFIVAFGVVSLSCLFGTLIGGFAAFRGGAADSVLVRVIDVFMAFPGILLAIALAGVMGPGIDNVIIALSVVGWVGYARLTRVQVLSLKQRDHVQAAHALGQSGSVIVIKHLLPLVVGPLIIEATFGVAGIVIAEAGLSFLGLGVQPPEASWGSMIKEGTRYMLVAPHLVLAPGVAILLVVLAINLLGDQLRDFLDVKTRELET